MPGAPTPGRMALPADLAEMQRQIAALSNQQTQVITDPTGATGDPAHGHATVVIGALLQITGLAGFGVAVWTGSGWGRAGNAGTVVSSLPASPVDGQEIDYLADATNGVVWHLKYRAASASAYKWEFIGGAPLGSEVPTNETTTSTTYVALTTPGPSVTCPLAGDYDVEIQAQIENSAATSSTFMSFDVGGTGAVDGDAIAHNVLSSGGWNYQSLDRRRRKTGLTAGTALVSKYKAFGGTGSFFNRAMFVTPVRVG